MRIGYDISQTGRNKAGGGYFADGLVRSLATIDGANQYTLYPTFGDRYFDLRAAVLCPIRQPNFRLGRRHLLPATARSFWSQPAHVLEATLGKPDIVHSNNFHCPRGFRHARVVYTLYDLGFLENPGWTTETNRSICLQGVYGAAAHADHVVAISEYSKDHFLRTFPQYPSHRISVVYPGSRFHDGVVPSRPRSLARLPAGQFWLTVGTVEPRKNHARLLHAFRKLVSSGRDRFPLVIAGGNGWLMEDFDEQIRAAGLREHVVRAGYVSDQELRWLYANCFANLYPSLFEGFGLPVLEGMSLGAIPVTSNVTSMPEITGDCGLLVAPGDSDSIYNAMASLMDRQVDIGSLKKKGVERSRLFNWDASAQRVLQIYGQVLDQPKLGTP